MKILLKKIIVISIPVGLLLLFPGTVVYLGREVMSFEDVVQTQDIYPTSLFGFAYNAGSFFPYKQFLVETKHPEVIALGTSRVMQFRREFFRDSSKFINAGGAGRSIEDIESFMNSLPNDGSVKVVILGVDKEVITSTYASKENKSEEILPVRFIKITIPMARRIYLDYFAHKYSLFALYKASVSSTNIGLSALLHGDGFRGDGSYRYGGAMSNSSRLAIVSSQVEGATLEAKNISNVEIQHKKINLDNNLKVLEKVILNAKEKGITVIGFMPPYPSAIYDQLRISDPTLKLTESGLETIFKQNNLPFFNAALLSNYGGKNSEFFDFIHGTDFMYAKILIAMNVGYPALGKYVDVRYLQNLTRDNRKDFFDF